MARIPLVEKADAAPRVADYYAKLEEGGFQVLNIYKALGNCPQFVPDFFKLGNRILFQGKLDPKLRELAILRVGYLAEAPYEYTKHEAIALKSGVSQRQVDDLRQWSGSSAYDEAERAVLQYTDEVSRGYRASDEAFADVRQHLDDGQVVELTVTIGYYEMICRVLEALQVDVEDDFEPF